ncbi:MAG: hypothetical protein AMXMBFR84_10470 [Candidatus Hydrogenedentota bacterium]
MKNAWSGMMLRRSALAAVVMLACFYGAAIAQEQPASETDSVDRDYAAELPRIPHMEPAEAQAAFEIHPGFRMDLLAMEPNVFDSVAASFDEDGRLYTVEMRGYSEQYDLNMSEIRLLEDTDGDGTFDKSSSFLPGLTWPTAVFAYDGGAFIAVPPDILYARDNDGDGVADEVKKVFTGFSLSNVQGLINSFVWGPDNRIYASASSSGGDVRRADDPNSPVVSVRGRDFSFDPRTLDYRAESGGAQHGMSFDNFYHRFASMNSDHIQLYMVEDRYLARNPYFSAPTPRISIASDGPSADVFRISPVEPWRVVRTRLRVKGIVPGPIEGGGRDSGYFTSATGVTIYRGDAWPSEYLGNAIIADVGSNLIHRKIVERKGVELVAHRADPGTEFIRSKDIWFRPVQFYNMPDGNLLVLDMYRETIEHPASLPPVIKKHLDLTSGHDRGRLYRIAPEGFQQPKPVTLSAASSLELAGLLDHANAWHRETAARLIYQRQDKSIVPALTQAVADAISPEGRMHSLYALAGLDALTRDVVLKALDDTHPQVRRHAVRVAERMEGADEAVLAKLSGMADDGDAEVRYQLAFSLGEAPSTPERNAALAAIALSNGGDKWFATALMSSLTLGAGEVLARLMDDATYRASEAGKNLIGDLARQTGATGRDEELRLALQKIDALPPAEDALAQTAVSRIVAGLQLSGRGGESQRVLAQSTRANALVASMIADARIAAQQADGETAKRVAAIRTLAFDAPSEAIPVLSGLLDQREASEVQAAALASLRGYDDPAVAQSLLNAWPTLSPTVRLQAVEALFSRKPWVEALLDAIAEGTFHPKDLESTRIRALQSSPDPAIKSRAENLLGDFDFSTRQAVVDSYRDALTMGGDAARGKEVFVLNCAQCHKVGDTGFDVGPNLVTVAQAGGEKILMNVLDPNSEINPQYVNYTIDTDDFQTHTGVIGSETATSITLKRANGETSTILRVNIESIRSENLSIMPEGLEQTIDKQAMADLIAFLTSIE